MIVGGRVDGYNGTDGTLIEVKNRTRRLFRRIVDYEKVQLHVRVVSVLPLDVWIDGNVAMRMMGSVCCVR